jgi:hypothetical protein
MSVSLSPAEKPKYSSPDKSLRAARAAVEACDSLSGDALAKQQARVKELLDMAEKQNQKLHVAKEMPVHHKSFIRLRMLQKSHMGRPCPPILIEEEKKT